MRMLILSLMLIGLVSTDTYAKSPKDAPPSDESIQQLIRMTGARSEWEGAANQMEPLVKEMMQGLFKDRDMGPDDRRVMDELLRNYIGMVKDAMKWEAYEPVYINYYKELLTQREVDGILAFYKTDAGKAVLSKLPLISQRVMAIFQGRMKELMPKLRQSIDDAIEQHRSAGTPDTPAEPAKP